MKEKQNKTVFEEEAVLKAKIILLLLIGEISLFIIGFWISCFVIFVRNGVVI